MNLDDSLKIINRQLIESKNRPLNSTEIIILRGIWQYKTYNQIAIEAGYSPGYFTNVAAPELYQRLSKIVAQRVTKKNCRILIEAYITNPVSQTNFEKPIENKSLANSSQMRSPRYPSCSVSLDSSFYLERSFGEQVERELKKPGALIRIKAPREMGKTSLLLRSLNYANRLGYYTVCLNLEQVEFSVLDEVNQFLRWLCANISQQLQFKPMLDQYWDEDLGSKISSTLYLQDYILESIDAPIVIALDEVNQVFEHPQVAKDFLPLLRSWYEEAKRLPVWQKLRLIVVHSTEIYVPLDLNQSPFNVGLPIQLNDFSLEEVRQLAQRYGLNWQDGETKQLMSLVGGHPALVNIALYHLSRQEITLSQLLKTATTATGIYAHHLQRHWITLDNQPELVRLLQMVLDANEPVLLDPSQTHKLSSMGLIKLSGDYAIASCELYRQYFTNKKAIFH